MYGINPQWGYVCDNPPNGGDNFNGAYMGESPIGQKIDYIPRRFSYKERGKCKNKKYCNINRR